jgi:Tol biopolymer transport system component
MITRTNPTRFLPAFIALFLLVHAGCKHNPANAPLTFYDFEGDVTQFNTAYRDFILYGTFPGPGLAIVKNDGSGNQFIDTPLLAFGGTWSPRKWKIFYLADTAVGPASPGLYLINVDGTGNRRVTPSSERICAAACAPDGQKIAYSVYDSVGRTKIKIIKPDGSGARDITGFILSNQFSKLSWSPDSRQIAFDGSRYSGGIWGIGYVVVESGFVASLFPPEGQQCYTPDWSHDGMKIAYITYSSVERTMYSNVFYYSLVTQKSYQVTSRKAAAFAPHWSPDSRQIIFGSQDYDGSGSHLYSVNMDGSGLVQLTAGSEYVSYPDW